MYGVESRSLRYFVAVAEELHFGRAAERIGIAQPPLSRAIRKLESQLGVELLVRNPGAISLTPAGETLLDGSRTAIYALEAAVRRTRRTAAGEPRLAVGLKADLDGALLDPALEIYEGDPAAIEVEIVLCAWGEQLGLVREGRADVALTYHPIDGTDLDFEFVLEEPQVAALSASHPLAARTALGLHDLVDHPQPSWAHEDEMESGIWLGPNGGVGLDERVDGLPDLLKRIELGHLVALLPRSVAARYRRDQIAFRPVHDAQPAHLSVVWPTDTRSLAVAAFVRAIQAAADQDATSAAPRLAPDAVSPFRQDSSDRAPAVS
jgi:DNA-binding transcriptional LysR family regulator